MNVILAGFPTANAGRAFIHAGSMVAVVQDLSGFCCAIVKLI